MEKREKKYRMQKVWHLVRMVVVLFPLAGVAGLTLGMILKENKKADGSLDIGYLLYLYAGLLLVYAVSYMIQLYMHEVGHLVFGLVAGYRFHSIRFGSLMFLKTESGIKVSRMKLAGTGGQCLMLPPQDRGDEIPTSLYNMGGCLVNLFFTIVGLVGYALVEKNSFMVIIWLGLATMGIFMVVINGVPYEFGGNDGYHTIILKKDAEARRIFRVQMEINAQLAKGVAIKDMPEEWFEWEEKVPTNLWTSGAGTLRFNYLFAQERYVEAKKLGEFLIEKAESMPFQYEALMASEILFLDIVLNEDVSKVKEKYQKHKKSLDMMAITLTVQRLRYAYFSCIEKDEKQAKTAIDLFAKMAKSYPYPTEVEYEKQLLALIEKKKASAA